MFPADKVKRGEIVLPVTRRTSFINKAACKKFIMDIANQRYHKFNRLNPAVYDELEGVLRRHMRAIVARNPSLGKTIR